jgi:hypothetical protein
VRTLQEIGVSIGPNILAAITHERESTILLDRQTFSVFSLVQVKREDDVAAECLKCSLQLPRTQDSHENQGKISSHDFWFMVEKSGWEPEPDKEVPAAGYAYSLIPKFSSMIERYGDWLTYKMALLLRERKTGPFFVVHPHEPAANKINERLVWRFERKFYSVKVPKEHINAAQKANNSWESVLREHSTEEWIEQLKSLKQREAVILDVFNASGSTFRSLAALLASFDIPLLCYLPLVDRHLKTYDYGVPVFSLYDWYGPRRLRA